MWEESAFSCWPQDRRVLDLELPGPRAGGFRFEALRQKAGIWLPKEQMLPGREMLNSSLALAALCPGSWPCALLPQISLPRAWLPQPCCAEGVRADLGARG